MARMLGELQRCGAQVNGNLVSCSAVPGDGPRPDELCAGYVYIAQSAPHPAYDRLRQP